MTLPLNQVICGDCLQVMKEFPDRSIDFVLTSPPYLDNEIPLSNYYVWLEKVLKELKRLSSVVLMFNSSRRLIEICKRFSPSTVLIWNKKCTMQAFRYEPIFVFADKSERLYGKGRIWNDCLSFAPIPTKNQIILNENPVKLYTQLLQYFPEKKIVLDPFAGSGTTAVACRKENRYYILIEIDSFRCELIQHRLAKEEQNEKININKFFGGLS